MYDPGNGQLRYLVHFSDGGSGMRNRDMPVEVGDELVDGGGRYRVVSVEPAPNPQAFGHVRVELRWAHLGLNQGPLACESGAAL